MRLTRFSVEGFKNLRKPVVLDGLEEINVLHGENNVGKSNVLQAILLFHWSVNKLAIVCSDRANVNSHYPEQTDEPIAKLTLAMTELNAIADRPPSLFDVQAPLKTIKLAGEFHVPNTLLPTGQTLAAGAIDVWLEVARPTETSILLSLLKFRHQADDPTLGAVVGPALLPVVLGWVSGSGRVPAASRFAIIHTDRWRQGILGDNPGRPVGGILPPEMEQRLYDARDTPDRERALTWRRFLDVMERFRDVLSEGVPNVVNPSRAVGGRGHPFLLADLPDGTRMPIDQMGSGVQQIVALLGTLLTSEAKIVAIEEPELNLRHSMQLRVMQALRDHVVGRPGGPDQLFLTSHSSAFEFGDTFYGMSAGTNGPTVARQERRNLAKFVGLPESTLTTTDGDSSVGWLTSEGIVRVPPFAVQHLGAAKGGAVVFWRDGPGRVELLTPEAAEVALDGLTAPAGEGDDR